MKLMGSITGTLLMRLTVVASICLLLASCTSFKDEETPNNKPCANTTFADVTAKVQKTCGQCHNSVTKAGGMDIMDYDDVFKDIVPNEPEKSSIYEEVTKGNMKNQPNETAAAEAAELLRCWIMSGGAKGGTTE